MTCFSANSRCTATVFDTRISGRIRPQAAAPPPDDAEPAAIDETPQPPATGEAEAPPAEDIPQIDDAIVDPENPGSLPPAMTDAELALALLQANNAGSEAPTA